MADNTSVVLRSSHQTKRPVKRFRHFPRLPAELRHMIWKLALEKHAKTRFIVFDVETRRIIPTARNVSPMLLVNQESRFLALKHYYTTSVDIHKICLKSGGFPGNLFLHMKNHIGDKKGKLYLDPHRDSVVVGIRLHDLQVFEKKTCHDYTTCLLMPDTFPLSPPDIFRVRNLWCRSGWSSFDHETHENRYFPRDDHHNTDLSVYYRRYKCPTFPEEFIECLSKWDTDSLKQLVLKRNVIKRGGLRIWKKPGEGCFVW